VINAAANVKHFGEIEQFYHDNVTSVLQLISFCKETNCVLHHISTYSVSAVEKKEVDPLVKSGDDKIDPIFTEYHMRDSNLLENPYLKTKMQAEEEILKAQKKDDLKANIYRVGNLVFNTRTNLHQINIDNNGFYQSLKCILNIGYACNHPSLDYAELSPVNETAKAIVLLLQQENLKNEIFHIYNENYYRISDIFSSKLKFLDLDSFLEKIKFYYDHPFVHDNINNYMLHSGWLNLNNQIEQVPISNEKTNLILNQLNFHWSQIRESNFIDMIDQSLKNRYELLQENKLLTPLGFEFIKDLSLYGRLSIVKENEIVMSKFVVSKSLYFILDGFAQISVLSDPGGWISSIGVLSQNDLIGVENTVSFENKNMIVDSILGDLVLLELEEKEFKYLKEKHGQFFDMLLIYSLKSLHNNNLLISNFA
jgi:thioester reductase-like protein